MFITQNVDDDDAVLGFLPTWLRELSARVEKLVIVTFQLGVMPALPKNCSIRSLGRERGAGKLALLINFRREMRAAIHEDGCDTVLAHMVPKYAVMARKLAMPRNMPLYLWYTHAGVNRWLLWCEPMVEKIFTASEESLRIATKKKVVTKHGIDIDYLCPSDDGPVAGRLITVGRLTPSKDVGVLIEGCSQLRAKGHAVLLEIIGDAMEPGDVAYGAAMRELAKKLSAKLAAEKLTTGEFVQFHGFVPYKQIPSVYRRANIFISASRTGSVDKAVLEAMACGSLVLTSNDSFRTILPREYIFKERDVDEFTKKAENLLNLNKEARAAAGRELRSIVARDHAVAPLMERLVREMSERAGGAR
ncbi:MAG: glycosyltransferase family 4 protein [Planctomycetota bacterium]